MNHKEYLQKNKIDITKKDIVFELSNLITEARLYAGISQTELARRMKTHQPSIARAESGALEPSSGFLQKVAKAVDTTFIPPKFGFMVSRERTAHIHVSARLIAGTQELDFSEKLSTPSYFVLGSEGYFTKSQSTSTTCQLLQVVYKLPNQYDHKNK